MAIGHSACSLRTRPGEAAGAGARLVTHLGNAMGPFGQREPGILGAALADDRLAVSMIADLVHIHPALVRIAFRAKGAGGQRPRHRCRGRPRPPPAPTGPGRPAEEPPRMADGTLVGSVLRMDRAVANTVGAAGVALAEAVAAASTTPARLLGLADRGAIAPGRRADLVALDARSAAWKRCGSAGEMAFRRP